MTNIYIAAFCFKKTDSDTYRIVELRQAELYNSTVVSLNISRNIFFKNLW